VNVPSLGGFGFFGASSEKASQQVRWLATVRGRAGVLVSPTFLIYGTAGLAFGQVNDSYSNTGVPTAFTGITIAANNDNVQWGFAGGAGAEWAFGGPWSAKVEYIYYHLTDDTVTLNFASFPNGAGTTVNCTFRNEGHIVRAGFNYKFGQ
jgi:outer membrane immunogenic protein